MGDVRQARAARDAQRDDAPLERPPTATRWKSTWWPLERDRVQDPPSGVSLASEIESIPTPTGACPLQVVPLSREATTVVTSPRACVEGRDDGDQRAVLRA